MGRNAQGKSAILEAIYLLATSKSHRTTRDTDLIQIGQKNARSSAEVVRSTQNDVSLEIVLSRSENKVVKINTVKHAKVGDIVGQLNAVIFSTADLDMVKGEPSRRRRFLNLEISQTSPHYVFALGRYKRVLDQRNNLLREIKFGEGDAGSLEVWDTQLAGYGATLTARRAQFVEFLSSAASGIYMSLTKGAEELKVIYKSSVEVDLTLTEQEISATFANALELRREVDLARGTTSIGPHRDDLLLSVNGLAAREYASQGQQRTVAIALKLAEIEIISNWAGETPVVLLDDIMAELDDDRRDQVSALTMDRCQTLITTTHASDLKQTGMEGARVFDVEAGRVTPR